LRCFASSPFAHNIFNSVLVSFTVVALSLLLGVTAAFALGRVRFRGRGLLLLTVLGVSMFSTGRGAVRHVRADPGPGTVQ
jgi:trehalose/maltose transport system permease protein